jgi:hypothetical protein
MNFWPNYTGITQRAKLTRIKNLKRLGIDMPQTGFEPVTYRLEGGCSIQLSYWGMALPHRSKKTPP